MVITHAAFDFISAPAAFEHEVIEEQIASHVDLVPRGGDGDRITRKRFER